MHFEQGHIYHIYNQGNNRQGIFFHRDNYLFFLKKMRTHLFPFGDILAYCLMPNHFHWMMFVSDVNLLLPHPETLNHRSFTRGAIDAADASFTRGATDAADASFTRGATDAADAADASFTRGATDAADASFTRGATDAADASFTRGATQSRTPSKTNLNKEIGILLASYTRAINKQQKTTGSLFRQKTKAECLTTCNGITPSFFNTEHGTKMYLQLLEDQYPQACFDYIHQNPVKAALVKKPEDWEFSSYPNYCGKRNGTLINKNATKKAGIIF